MQAVILAAGRGKRLYPLTLKRSKAMLPVLGKPMVARIIDSLVANGIQEFIIVTSPTDPEIVPYFQHNVPPSVEIQMVEQPEVKGMAHALSCAEPLIRDEFILSACDSLLYSEDYARLISVWRQAPRPAALLALLPVDLEGASQTALVRLEESRITQIIEKPNPDQFFSNIASLPVYFFDRRIFFHLSKIKPSKRGELELQDAIQSLIDSDAIIHGEGVSGRLNLTTAQDLLEINLHFLKAESPQFLGESVHLSSQVSLIPPYSIGPRTTIDDRCTIGPCVYIESDAYLGQGSRVSYSVLLKGARLGAQQHLDHTILSV